MNKAGRALMEWGLRRVDWGEAKVLDVGSLYVNGSFRAAVEGRGWKYTGLDIKRGRNVDVVTSGFEYPFGDGAYDVVISGSTMEHVTAIWRWVPELVRVLRPGGLLVVVTHMSWRLHQWPVDCWRILPDGMRYLFDLTGVLEGYAIVTEKETDIMGSAFKSGCVAEEWEAEGLGFAVG